MSLRLSDLRNFVEISSFPTLSEGARRLGITQPALSESIKRLESDVGETLLYRSKSGVSLTPSGRKVLERAKAVQGILSELEPGAGKSVSLPVVTLGCHAVVGSYVLPEALGRLQAAEPGFRVEIRHGLSRQIQDEVQRGIVDVGIVINAIRNPDLVVRRLGKDRVTVWKAKGVEVSDRVICDPALFQTQSILRKWKRRPEQVISTGSLELIGRLTEAGIGVGILPERAVKLLKGDLVQVAGTPEHEDELSLLYRPEFGRTPYERRVLEALGTFS